MSNPTIILVGRLGQDPDPIGDSGIRLRVVTNDRSKNDSTGEWEDRDTSWWTVKAWGKLSEQSKKSLKKGQEVMIQGKIYEENWQDNTGAKRTAYEIKADQISITLHALTKANKPEDIWANQQNEPTPF